MENIAYVDELIKEYFLFRGYVKSYTCFTSELSGDKAINGNGVDPDYIGEQLINHIRQLELTELMNLWNTLHSRFFTHLPTDFTPSLRVLDTSLKRAYLIKAVKSHSAVKVREFFDKFASEFIGSSAPSVNTALSSTATSPVPSSNISANGEPSILQSDDWEPWFVLPYVNDPASHPFFAPYFNKRWFHTLSLSLRNFLMSAFSAIPLPKLLAYGHERAERRAMMTELKSLRLEVERLRQELKVSRASLPQAPSPSPIPPTTPVSSSAASPSSSVSKKTSKPTVAEKPEKSEKSQLQPQPNNGTLPTLSDRQSSSDSIAKTVNLKPVTNEKINEKPNLPNIEPVTTKVEIYENPAFTTMSICALSGHSSPIVRSRFSYDGQHLATASREGLIKVWNVNGLVTRMQEEENSTSIEEGKESIADPVATFVSMANMHITSHSNMNSMSELTCMEWDERDDSVLLYGTNDGKIRMWHIDTRRLMGEFDVLKDLPVVLTVASSPSDPQLVASTASKAYASMEGGKGILEAFDLATSRRTWSYSSDSPSSQINSLMFNHNGNMLLTGSGDGIIRLFDMNTRKPIMKWQGHTGQIHSVKLCSDETSLVSIGADGNIFQWSLQQMGKKVATYHLPNFAATQSSPSNVRPSVSTPRIPSSTTQSPLFPSYDLAMDWDAEHFVVSSSTATLSSVAYLFDFKHSTPIQILTGSNAALTSVDWHCAAPIVVTGDSDSGVQVRALRRRNVSSTNILDDTSSTTQINHM